MMARPLRSALTSSAALRLTRRGAMILATWAMSCAILERSSWKRCGFDASGGTREGSTFELCREVLRRHGGGRAHPTWDHHGGVSPRGAARARRRIPGASAQGVILPRRILWACFTQPGFPAPGPGPIPHCVTRSLPLASAVTTGCLCPLNSSTRSGAPPRPHHRPAPGALDTRFFMTTSIQSICGERT